MLEGRRPRLQGWRGKRPCCPPLFPGLLLLGEFRDWPKALTDRSQYLSCCPSTAAEQYMYTMTHVSLHYLTCIRPLLFRLQCALSDRSMCPMPPLGRSKNSLKYALNCSHHRENTTLLQSYRKLATISVHKQITPRC